MNPRPLKIAVPVSLILWAGLAIGFAHIVDKAGAGISACMTGEVACNSSTGE